MNDLHLSAYTHTPSDSVRSFCINFSQAYKLPKNQSRAGYSALLYKNEESYENHRDRRTEEKQKSLIRFY